MRNLYDSIHAPNGKYNLIVKDVSCNYYYSYYHLFCSFHLTFNQKSLIKHTFTSQTLRKQLIIIVTKHGTHECTYTHFFFYAGMSTWEVRQKLTPTGLMLLMKISHIPYSMLLWFYFFYRIEKPKYFIYIKQGIIYNLIEQL